ncbi:ATP-binding protein [Actinomadura parmotrematis]|uniref:ATP-binding protein n=1 Tax=Actinomadura parmotrematis TaxID=2864039 RepID=A0ABS7FQ68_9ACTN|nr:ATP-binding protein [Actinomadura parmotrematis]MBW8481899.1 ATP-binding protein [Actinomadura parmotrematis]
MKITPSSRILRMLGEIEFDEWQCIAELVDNALDDFSEIERDDIPWAGGFKVSVSLPSPKAKLADAVVKVSDTGRGMSYDRLEQSVRAGWSSNDRFDKLGLFGMGFNVSTARLGRRTRVLTTRRGDDRWIGVEIDLDQIGDDFEAQDIEEAKADPNEHGTRIEISGLHPDRADWLRRNASNLRETLGRTYSWILDNKPFELWVQGQRVKPRLHCRWGDDRAVTYGQGGSAERIPAYIAIDETFDPAEACTNCGNWQVPDKGTCEQCGGDRLTLRERRIHGWLGVQRHLHKREFGIDFLRNGRKILQWDKRLFDWKNPNDPATGAVDTEYPIELANQGGRLIGEIHLDHVPVTYQKNAFEYSDRGWRAAIDYLRGVGPMQPEKAKRLGYPVNDSPLAQLYRGYRRNAAGLRCLIPGDGKGPIHDETRRWAQLFHQGDADYQDDQRWWDAVVNHEELSKAAKLAKAEGAAPYKPDEAAVLEALGVAIGESDTPGAPPGAVSSADQTPASAPAPPSAKTTKETFQERIARYRADSTIVPELTRDFGIPRIGDLRVETRRLSTVELRDTAAQPTPVLLVQGPGGTGTAFVDPAHQVFAKLGADPTELLIVEIAAVLKVKAESDLTHAQLIALLRAHCLLDLAPRMDVVFAQARELLSDVRRMMALRIDADPGRAFQYLSPDELTATENEMIANGQVTHTQALGQTGEFLLYAPPLFVVRLLEEWPETFMDGHVFAGPYASVSSLSARRLSVAKVAGYLNDIATLLSFTAERGPQQLQRTRLSIQLLADELVAEA